MLKTAGLLLAWIFGSNLSVSPYRLLVMDSNIDSTSQPVVINYYPNVDKALVIALPRNLRVVTAGGYGKYQLGSISNLAKQEKKDLEFSRQTYTKAFGLNINQVVLIDKIPMEGTQIDAVKLLRKSGWKASSNLWWKFLSLGDPDIKTVEFTAADLGDIETDVDGGITYSLNTLKSDSKINRIQQDYLLLDESLSLTIENATNITGLAQNTKRIMDTSGWDVIRISDGSDELPYTIILLGDEKLKNNPLVKELPLLFPGSELRVENTEGYRTEVVLRLGYRGKGFWD